MDAQTDTSGIPEHSVALIATPVDVREAPGPLTPEQITELCAPGPIETIDCGGCTIHFGNPSIGIPANLPITALLHHLELIPSSMLITGTVVITKS